MKKRVLLDCEHDSDLKAAAKLYKEGKITIREASDITRIPLRGILHEFGKMGIFTRYGEDEIKEDIERLSEKSIFLDITFRPEISMRQSITFYRDMFY